MFSRVLNSILFVVLCAGPLFSQGQGQFGNGSSGSGSGTVTNTGGALTSNSVVLGAGGSDTKVSTGITTNGASELDLGIVGTNGVLGLNGLTSGKATITAPAVAGTSTNPFVFSNALSLPDGTTAGPALFINDAGFYRSTTTTWRWEAGGTDRLLFNTTSIQPVTTGTVQLGAIGSQWSNIFSLGFQTSSANAANWLEGSNSELLTLSTSGTTTDTVGNLLPANSEILSVVARVITTITTATSWQLGDANVAGRFTAADSVMTANEVQVGLVQMDQTGTSGPRQTAAAKVRVTTVGTPGAGSIRITVFFRTYTAPTS